MNPAMAQTETMGILDEIQYLVSDKLQVVSYKWLSRNFSVSSDDAKRLLQDFVEKHGTGIEALYTLAGWMKNDPSSYRVRLASKPTLTEAKQEFDENCSVEIYSVQACLPKDSAVLGNVECVQAGELFKQPHDADNCLRDNRFCRVSNSFVKRNGGGTQGGSTGAQVKSAGAIGLSVEKLTNQSPTLPQPHLKRVQETSKLQSDVVKDVKNNSHIPGAYEQSSKPAQDEEKVPVLPVVKKVADNKFSGNRGALANMWGRASSKLKPECASAETSSTHNSSDTQICAREEIEHESSDDEYQGVNIKRQSNGESGRKRKVVFYDSDEEDEYKDAVNLASPDPPKKQLTVASKQTSHSSDLEKNTLNFEEKEKKANVKKGEEADRGTNQIFKEESLALSKGDSTKTFSAEKGVNNVPVGTISKDKVTDTASRSPQRRKVLKTRIDERGREVTEVVWEGDEAETKSDSNTMKKLNNIATSNTDNRPSAIKKSPAVGNNAPLNQGGKAANKKAGNKDPKQGNILSFFKRV